MRTLDRFADSVYLCPPDQARRGGVHLLSAAGRGLPTWHGYTLPIVGLSDDAQELPELDSDPEIPDFPDLDQ